MFRRFLPLFLALLISAAPALADEAAVVSVDATSWIEGKDPTAYVPWRMIDGAEDTSFQFSVKTTPLGQLIIYFYFDRPYDIDTLWIKNGFWKITNGLDQYTRNSRVKEMRIDFLTPDVSDYGNALKVTLPDDKTRAGWTRVSLGQRYQVSSLRFRIMSIYKGTKYPNDVCISEVRFTGGSASVPQSGLYGLATMKLATRTGPGTQYTEGGTYMVEGQYIHVLARAWDSRNGIWWVKCEIPYRNELRVLWTGYKRFDPSTLPLESIPIEYY